MKKDYALYKGDKFIELGTKDKIAILLGVKINTISFYATPTYRKRGLGYYGNRYIVIRIEDD